MDFTTWQGHRHLGPRPTHWGARLSQSEAVFPHKRSLLQRETLHLSSVPVAIESEQFPTEVGYDAKLQSRQVPGDVNDHSDELHWDLFWQFVQKLLDCANPQFHRLFGWLVSDNPAGEEAGCGSPGAGVVTCDRQLWGQLDVLLDLKDAPAVSMPIARALSLRHLWHCVVWQTQLHIWEWPFIVPCTCVMIMLFNQLLDMPHLSGGWIIWERIYAYSQGFKQIGEQNVFFVRMDLFWHLFCSWNMGPTV